MPIVLMLILSLVIVNVRAPPPNVAITDMKGISPTVLKRPDDVVSFNVTVENQGTEDATFNLTTWWWSDIHGDEANLENRTVASLGPGTNQTFVFFWNTSGLPDDRYGVWAELYYEDIFIDAMDGPDELIISSIKVYVEPSTTVGDVDDFFTLNITVANVWTDWPVNSWEVVLNWDSAILDTDETMIEEGPFLKEGYPPGSTTFLVSVGPLGARIGCSGMTPSILASGNGTLAYVTFEVEGTGKSDLDLSETTLADVSMKPIAHRVEDGVFYTPHPIAEFTYSPRYPLVGEIVYFNATASYDTDGEIIEYAWDFDDGTTLIDTDPITVHAYNESKTYTVNLTVTDNSGLKDSITSGELTPTRPYVGVDVVIHDIAVIDIQLNTTLASPGDIVAINVTVLNQGYQYPELESVNVTAYYDITPIPPTEFLVLSEGENKTVTFNWNTTGVAVGTYVIWANACLVDYYTREFRPGELDTADNTLVDGQVELSAGVPRAIFTVDPSIVLAGETVTFNASASYDTYPKGDPIANYTWNFGDGNITTTTDSIITHKYAETKTYTVTLTVTDNDKLNGTAVNYVKVSFHNIAVTNIVVSPTTVDVGENITITVFVENIGGFPETFDLTAYYGDDIIDSKTDITLKGEAKTERAFMWNSTGVSIGNHTIKAIASVVPGEINEDDNTKIYGEVTLTAYDIAITFISVSATTVKAGENLTISVTVKNEGSFNETFKVTALYETYTIGTQNVTDLPPGSNSTLTFTWNTAPVPIGTHTISAKASEVAGERDKDDNTKTYGTITIEKSTSTISVATSPTTIMIGDIVTIDGTLDPDRSLVDVTIWYRLSGEETWNNLTAVQTNKYGKYVHVWEPQDPGDYEVKASWEGDAITESSESSIQTVEVQAAPFITLNIILMFAAGLAVGAVVTIILAYFLKIRKLKPTA